MAVVNGVCYVWVLVGIPLKGFVPLPILTSLVGFSGPRPFLHARGVAGAELPDNGEFSRAEGSSGSVVIRPSPDN